MGIALLLAAIAAFLILGGFRVKCGKGGPDGWPGCR